MNFLLFVTVDLMLNGLAIIDFVSGKSHSNWAASPSTKIVNLK